MPIEQALKELERYAQEFTNIGDAEQAIQTNKDAFLSKWAEVNRYFKYVVNNVEFRSPEWIEALEIVSDIADDNPSLGEWVDMIVVPKEEKTATQSHDNTSIDTTVISNNIEAIISELNSMQQWNPDHIDDLEWKLQEYQDYLVSNQNAFDQNLYQSLMRDIDVALNKISKFYAMLNSETMEGIKKM